MIPNKKIEDVFTYVYPIVGMYAYLYEQILDTEKRKTAFYEFAHTASLADHTTTFVPAPNNDTTYSRAWIDLRYGPVIIETPDTKGRFFTIQMLDMYSEVFGNLGKRLYGTEHHKFMIVGPNYEGKIPEDVHVVHCNTYFAMAFLRVLIGSSEQLPEVKRIQQQIMIYPYHKPENVDMDFPKLMLEPYVDFLQVAKKLLPMIVPHDAYLSNVQEVLQCNEKEIQESCQIALDKIIEGGMQFGENVHQWRIARVGIGTYGDDYFQRAVVWYKGALANVAEESLYPTVFVDDQNEMLDGKHHYVLRFEKDEMPPVSQFWSLTMYIFRNGFLAENEIQRYSLGDRTKDLQYDEEGGLTIYIQHERPMEKHLSNWLPAPAEPFYITLRLYGPSKEAINGEWNPPYVQKVQE